MVNFNAVEPEEHSFVQFGNSVVTSCFDVTVDLGVAKIELWPTWEATKPIKSFFVSEPQSYYRYEGDLGPVRVEVAGIWTGRINYYDLIT